MLRFPFSTAVRPFFAVRVVLVDMTVSGLRVFGAWTCRETTLPPHCKLFFPATGEAPRMERSGVELSAQEVHAELSADGALREALRAAIETAAKRWTSTEAFKVSLLDGTENIREQRIVRDASGCVPGVEPSEFDRHFGGAWELAQFMEEGKVAEGEVFEVVVWWV